MSFHSVLIGCEVFQVYNEDKRKSGVTQSGPNRPAAHRQWGSKVPIKTVLKITLCHALNARSPCVFFCFVFFVNPFNSLLYGWRRWKKKMNEISFSLPKSTIKQFYSYYIRRTKRVQWWPWLAVTSSSITCIRKRISGCVTTQFQIQILIRLLSI